MTTTFLVTYKPGDAWVAGKSSKEPPLSEHGKYMLRLFTLGKMKMAGPFNDDTGGAVVLEVDDEAEALELLKEDPAIKTRFFEHEVHPWGLVAWDRLVKPH
ncbi:MAG: YciI family protein [Candidatus Methylophosphatis roskildensis]